MSQPARNDTLGTPPPATGKDILALAAILVFTPLAVSLEISFGYAALAVAVVSAALSKNTIGRRNLLIIAACVGLLSVTPINTDLSDRHFLTLGIPFFAVVAGPFVLLKLMGVDPGWRFFPRRWAWSEIRRDVFYTIISVPLAWAVIGIYFHWLTPDLAMNWPMPQPEDPSITQKLIVGINSVGIWDELFFINTVYVLMRGVFSPRIAIPAQAVIYTAILWDMAFRGWGPVIVYGFALTQGIMYEKSGTLLWVLIVHLIVDFFLVVAILNYHYPVAHATWMY